jgi:hypothetical protein
MRATSLIVVSGALVLGACTPDYVKQDQSSILFRMVSISPNPMSSDVLTDSGSVEQDTADVALAVRPKNVLFSNVPQVAMAVFIERYEVRYFRTDGRNVEGVDVPVRISGGMTGVIDVATSGSTAFPVEVVRRQAKLEPPLRNMRNNNNPALGGSIIVMTVFADITVHGRTVSGEAVQAQGRMQIDFGDFQ